jgi:hypothetical protein
MALQIADRNASAAEEGARATKQLTEVGQRPWVNHKDVSLRIAPTPSATAVVVEASSTVVNSGNTPALELKMAQTLEIFDKIPPVLEYPAFGEKSSFAPLGPNSSSNIFCRQDFATQDFQAATRSEKILCLYGRAVYNDCFGKTHETRWCLYYESRLEAFAYTGAHNTMS